MRLAFSRFGKCRFKVSVQLNPPFCFIGGVHLKEPPTEKTYGYDSWLSSGVINLEYYNCFSKIYTRARPKRLHEEDRQAGRCVNLPRSVNTQLVDESRQNKKQHKKEAQVVT